MSEYSGQNVFLLGYREGVRDARKEIAEIARLKKQFDIRTVDLAVKDLLKNLIKDDNNEHDAKGNSEMV